MTLNFTLKLSNYIIKTFYVSQMNPKNFSTKLHFQFNYHTLSVTPFNMSLLLLIARQKNVNRPCLKLWILTSYQNWSFKSFDVSKCTTSIPWVYTYRHIFQSKQNYHSKKWWPTRGKDSVVGGSILYNVAREARTIFFTPPRIFFTTPP